MPQRTRSKAQPGVVDGGRRVGGVDDRWAQAGSGQLLHHRSEPFGLAVGEGVGGLVGHRAVGPETFQLERGARRHLHGPGERIAGSDPDAVHAGVDLEVDGDHDLVAGRHLCQPGHGLSAMDGGSQAEGDHVVPLGRGRLAEDEDGCVDARRSQRRSLAGHGHRQPRRSRRQRRPGHLHRAVAVTVGLDHRTQLGRCCQGRQQPDVGGDHVVIHLGPRRAPGKHRCGVDRRTMDGDVHAARDRATALTGAHVAPRGSRARREVADGSGEQRREVAGHQATTPAEVGGTTVEVGAGGGGPGGREPGGQEGGDDAGEHVAGAGGGQPGVTGGG